MVHFLVAGSNTVRPKYIYDMEESKPNRGLPHGMKPSDKDVEEHERTHVPFRSWCKHCVKGKAKSHPHYSRNNKEEYGVPIISWDYFYMK
jgi:hypothetical protein